MTVLSEFTQDQGAPRTTWMRRYTLDPAVADEFVEFLTTKVAPARQDLGFTIESMWLDADKSQLTWFVSRPGDAEEYAAAERGWEESDIRAAIFADAPAAVTGKDLRQVSRLH